MDYIDTINSQHKELLEKLELILPNNRLKENIQDFLEYLKFHFAYEENIQQEIEYFLLEDHKLEHNYTIMEVNGLLLRYKIPFTKEYDINIILNIIYKHINEHDAELMKFINERKQ